MIPTLFGITLVTFLLLHLAPGDPSAVSGDLAQVGQGSRASVEAFRKAMGFDQPLPVRYGRWVARLVALDFGVSSYDHRAVSDKLAESLPVTLMVSGLALLLAYLLAVPLGVGCAVRRGSLVERVVSTALAGVYALPSYFVAVALVLLLAGGRYLDLFPMQGLHSAASDQLGPLARLADLGWHLVLPVVCLTYAPLSAISRYTRSSMLDVLSQDYVRTARAKGLPERTVIWRHALRNALLPLVTMAGMSLPHLIAGSVIVEQVFGLPGMGRLAYQAISARDYNTVMAVTTLAALLTLGGTLLADVGYSLVDPRIRRRGGAR